jgi:LmbE family N-acetylglucosaminyl deacetylase
MKTLIIAPHFDDESISCAGLIQKRTGEGGKVHVMAMHGRRYGEMTKPQQMQSDEEEMDDLRRVSRQWLDFSFDAYFLPEGEPQTVGFYALLERIEEVLGHWQPYEVVIPGADDLNQDHRHLNHVCQIALRPINLGRVKRVLEFHALDGRTGRANYFVALTEEHLRVKVSAINCYRRERRELPSPRAPENVQAQARIWGAMAGVEFAEGYTLLLEKD